MRFETEEEFNDWLRANLSGSLPESKYQELLDKALNGFTAEELAEMEDLIPED